MTPSKCIAAAFSIALTVSIATAQNVVILVIDGMRYSESFGAADTNMPNLWNTLRPQGSVWTNFRNDSVTWTCSGHATIASGAWQDVPDDGSVRPTSPTLFEYFRKATASPETSCALVIGKLKLDILSYSSHADYGEPYRAPTHAAFSDSLVVDSLRSVLGAYKPRLVIVHLADVDYAGHTGSYAAYISAIRRADSLTAVIWDFLQADPFYGGKTTLFVTNDHGRHDDASGGFQHHGDSCEGCQHIMLLAIGRSVVPGGVWDGPRFQIDIAPTVGSLLEFPTPLATGANLIEGIIASVAPSGIAEGPGFALLESYPNPFNGTTRITYEIRRPANIRLAVYDLLGREAALLYGGPVEAGIHSAVFDAGTSPSGLYIVRLSSVDFVGATRILLLK